MYEIESYDDEARMYYEYCQYEYQKAKDSEYKKTKYLNQRKYLKGENYEFNNKKRRSKRYSR